MFTRIVCKQMSALPQDSLLETLRYAVMINLLTRLRNPSAALHLYWPCVIQLRSLCFPIAHTTTWSGALLRLYWYLLFITERCINSRACTCWKSTQMCRSMYSHVVLSSNCWFIKRESLGKFLHRNPVIFWLLRNVIIWLPPLLAYCSSAKTEASILLFT